MPATTYSPRPVWRGRPRPRCRQIEPSIPVSGLIVKRCSSVTDEYPEIQDNSLVQNWRPRVAAPKHHHMSANSAMLAKYRYRRRLPHLQKADANLFVTLCTGAQRILPGEARDLVRNHCLREGGILPLAASVARAPSPAKSLVPRIHLHRVVVMPDHVHLLPVAPRKTARSNESVPATDAKAVGLNFAIAS